MQFWFALDFRWIRSQAKKDGAEDTIAKYDGKVFKSHFERLVIDSGATRVSHPSSLSQLKHVRVESKIQLTAKIRVVRLF